ncbi:glycerophosphoryl diester phosphodiesterase membrane domain-containing protein [Streptomyces sp. NPDC006012]|uniref:glycerophosphoryl diester phosphodiesterase membrane domain-containing protein n=1 Tax=Streptomyces sp. NPDC006012 TaxID=3364739 RepID=UPI00368B9193
MNDTPGWASPGSTPSNGQEPGASGPAEPAGRPVPAQPADQPGADPQAHSSKWSKEQPPPGQWSAPTGAPAPGQAPPPAPPGPGWGGPHPGGQGGHGGYGGPAGYGGWGAGWGGPPPAAKPGVIPLRPLGVGEILDGAVSTMRTYWRTVLGISLTVAVVTEIVVVLLQGLVLDDTATTDALTDPSASFDELSRAMGESMLSSAAVLLISFIGTIVATALLTTVTSRAVLGRPVTSGEAWRDARPQLGRLFGLICLLPLISLGIMLCGALPGILVAVAGAGDAAVFPLLTLGLLAAFVVVVWLMVRFSLASPALMLERQGILKSMSRSAKLVRGSWWRVFGIQLLAGIIANIIASIVIIPFALIGAALSGDGFSGFLSGTGGVGWTFLIVSGIGSVIGSTVTFPISAGAGVLLYIDQRIRREALDLELARAAGVQDYGVPAPGATPGS